MILALFGVCIIVIAAYLLGLSADVDRRIATATEGSVVSYKAQHNYQPNRLDTGSADADIATKRDKQLEYPPERIAKEQAQWDEERKQLGIPIERVPIVQIEANHIAGAIYYYHQMFKVYPSGTNAEIAKLLFGENPAKTPILAWRPRNLSKGGELLDPWGTPYQIQAAAEKIEIRSAGPNRVFWDADDQVAK